MKKISRFLALLLALVMLMLPFAAFAADFSTDLQSLNKADYDKILEYVLNGQFKEAADRIFQQLTGIETADALYDALIGLGVDYDLLSNAQLDQLIALLEQIRAQERAAEEEQLPKDVTPVEAALEAIKDYTNVAGFKAPVTGTALLRMLAAANDAQQDDNGVVLKKTATDNGDDTYTIRMEVYATGEKTTTITTKEIPTDIILVLDQSGSMDDDYEIVTGYSYNQINYNYNYNYTINEHYKANLYYKASDGEYWPVTITYSDSVIEAMPSSTTNDSYWNQRNNLYQDPEGKTKLTVERTGSSKRRTYTYKFEDGDITSIGATTIPDLKGKTIYVRRNNIDRYTYTCVINGVETIISTSDGHYGSPQTTDGKQLVLYTRTAQTQKNGKKLDALKNSVESFVKSVATKAQANGGINHRIAVVGFASESGNGNNTELLSITGRNSGSVGVEYNSITDQNLKDVLQSMDIDTGRNMVTAAVNALAANGATQIDLGMDMAERILNANPVPEGEQRNRVVVVFTDGSPTNNSGFQINVANSAISTANSIKNAGATVYTIGIFSGADATSAGTEPSKNLDNWYDSNQIPPACNWFMQQVSSNNGSPRTPSYYLTPSDEGGLNAIFQQISSEIETGGSSTTLEEETQVNDYLTPQFYLPKSMTAADVTLESWKLTGVDTNGEYTWEQNADAMGAVATIDRTTKDKHGVSVTGFDFKDNWCGAIKENGIITGYRGNKLVIIFTANLRDGFLGGDGVITNTDDSGVYDKDRKPVEKFEKPDVDVPTDAETIAINANIFLGGYYKDKITPDDIKAKTEVDIKGTKLDLTKPDYGLEDWQSEYIDSVDVSLTDENGETITEIPQLENDFTYTATVTVKLKPDKDGKQTTVTKTDNGTIYVFKPEVTYKDTESNVGADLRGYVDNYVSTRWKNIKGQYSDDPDVKMVAGVEAPALIFTYAPSGNGKLDDADPPLDANNNLPVQVSKVEIDINGTLTNVLKDTTFIRNACTICGFVGGTVDTTGETWTNFVIHVLNGDLTITKTGCSDLDPNQSFVFTVSGGGLNGQTIEVVIHGNGSVTIQDLPCGEYTVTENTAWSWRYEPVDASKKVTVTGTVTEVPFNNSRQNVKWLDGNAYSDNRWINGQTISSSN